MPDLRPVEGPSSTKEGRDASCMVRRGSLCWELTRRGKRAKKGNETHADLERLGGCVHQAFGPRKKKQSTEKGWTSV